jgi:cell division protein FtsQ
MTDEAERVPTDPRLSRRRRAVARLRRRRIAARIAVGLTVAVGLWLALWSPLLRVRSVTVIGARHTTSADVAAAARLADGDNLLLLSTPEVASRTEALPWVRRARVERKLPGTVRVTITERRPAMVFVAGRRRWTLDGSGRVLTEGRAGRALTVLAARDVAPVVVGRRIPGAAARAAVAAYRALRGPGRGRIRAVFAPSPERITFRLTDGTFVGWGSADRLASKRAVMRALLRRLRRAGRSAAYVDVSVPESPAVSDLPRHAAPLELLRARPAPSAAR